MLSIRFLAIVSILQQMCWSLYIQPDPVANAEQRPVVVYFPGANVPVKHYTALLTKIQSAFQAQNVELHAIVLEYKLPPFIGAGRLVRNALKVLDFEPSEVILAGHSLGGVLAQDLAFSNAEEYSSLWLHGAFVQEKHWKKNPSFSILTVSGSRDGQNRLPYIANQYKHTQFPSVIIQGMNHAQICDDFSNDYMKKSDLSPLISLQEAHQQMSDIHASFYSQSTKWMTAVEKSNMMYFQPFMSLYDNDATGFTCGDMQKRIFEEFSSKRSIELTFQPNIRKFGSSRPQVTQSTINCPYWTQREKNPIGTSAVPFSIIKLRCKMKSKQAVYGEDPTQYSSCRQLNQALYDQVLNSMVPSAEKEAYLKSGRVLKFVDDKNYSKSSQWTNSNLKLSRSGPQLEVQLPALQTATGTGKDNGMFYCSVMSLSRLYEYIMIESQQQG